MATYLWVEDAIPFQLSLVLPKIGESLRFTLGLTYVPNLVGTKLWKPEEVLPDSYYFDWESDYIGMYICGENALVSISPANNRKAIYVSPDYWRTKLEYALAAAVVIAISEISKSQISDPALAYIKEPTLPPKEFAESIRVDGTFDDINEAAQSFFSRLPMSPE